MRYKEFVLEPGESLYVLGDVRRESPDDPPHFYKGTLPYIVSDKGQDTLIRNSLFGGIGSWVGAVAAIALGLVLLLRG